MCWIVFCYARLKELSQYFFKYETEKSVFESRYCLSDLNNVRVVHAYVMLHSVYVSLPDPCILIKFIVIKLNSLKLDTMLSLLIIRMAV
jgi:hypothetical protein